jgi:hypothetical protein
MTLRRGDSFLDHENVIAIRIENAAESASSFDRNQDESVVTDRSACIATLTSFVRVCSGPAIAISGTPPAWLMRNAQRNLAKCGRTPARLELTQSGGLVPALA